ncbi:hypothetical protein V2I01_19280 [Micromonospora sp. BRA006-A]|nr:hypothetical protein [Micromonospora sp. BRA006-A]
MTLLRQRPGSSDPSDRQPVALQDVYRLAAQDGERLFEAARCWRPAARGDPPAPWR